mgnify:CR=1 FL=1
MTSNSISQYLPETCSEGPSNQSWIWSKGAWEVAFSAFKPPSNCMDKMWHTQPLYSSPIHKRMPNPNLSHTICHINNLIFTSNSHFQLPAQWCLVQIKRCSNLVIYMIPYLRTAYPSSCGFGVVQRYAQVFYKPRTWSSNQPHEIDF